MDAVFALEEATVAHDSVRVTMAILEKKGYLTHRQEGGRNVYRPTVPRERARRSAMRHLTETFFDGSPKRAILAFLEMSGDRLSEEEMEEILARIERQERAEGRGSGTRGNEHENENENEGAP